MVSGKEMIPGENLLQEALSVIAPQSISYFKAVGRLTNAIGLDVTEYAAAVEIRGSIQPVPQELFEKKGLDFQKTYFTLYTTADAVGINRDISGDQIVFNGQRMQCLSITPWRALDGWIEILCVVINNAG